MSTYRNVIHGGSLARFWTLLVILMVISSFTASSQESRRERRARRGADKVELLPDSLAVPALPDSVIVQRDSIARADSIAAADSVMMLKKSSLDAPAFTAARDSIIEDFSDGKRIIYYYGDVSVTYGNMKLTADYME